MCYSWTEVFYLGCSVKSNIILIIPYRIFVFRKILIFVISSKRSRINLCAVPVGKCVLLLGQTSTCLSLSLWRKLLTKRRWQHTRQEKQRHRQHRRHCEYSEPSLHVFILMDSMIIFTDHLDHCHPKDLIK